MGSGPRGDLITVALVEDTDVVVEGVRAWVDSDSRQRARLISTGRTIEEVLAGEGRTADVLVLDLELDGVMVTERVAELADAGFVVVVFSVHVKPLIVQSVLDAGAFAFLDKRTEREHFVDIVVSAGTHTPIVTPSMAGGMIEAPQLSPRERQALLHLFQGMSYTASAARMQRMDASERSVSPVTVKQYVNRARAKFAALGRPCRSNFALLARCIETGLIRPEEIDDYRTMAKQTTIASGDRLHGISLAGSDETTD